MSRFVHGAAAALILALSACASVNSTADAPAISDAERARAGQQHAQILQQFGGAVEGPVAAYVAQVGAGVANAANVSGRCTFTVVNTDVVNAFAVSGCYIYITRGLLAIMNSEDELASVLGHEVGHVVADHSDRRQNAATLSTLGALIAGLATGSGEIAQAAGQAAQLYTLGYSRDQEFEADDLGVRYLRAAGYNAYAAADMLHALGVNDALSARVSNRSASAIPAWARTHPLSADRVTRANAQAQNAGAVREAPPERTAPYYAAVNGMIFGDDPQQGFVNGRAFAHPGLRLAFEAPDGFSLTNTPAAVVIANPANLRAQFSGGPLEQGGLQAYAQSVLQRTVGQAQTQVGRAQQTTINGLETVILPARAQTQSGQVVEVDVAAYRVGDRAYHFLMLAPDGGAGPFSPMVQSMRRLTDAQAAALRPRRVEVVTVGARDSVQALANRMAFDDFKLERFLALNGLEAGQTVRAGQSVKIVVFES
ncbi:MAG: M48 family metalloprotease [Alphaproteobacteria bacterium]|nr:M48 family metalloprotease [Alphaproteobacteria bacterium]